MSEIDGASLGRGSLLRRIYAVNVGLIVLAWAFLAFTPASVKPPVVVAGMIGVAALVLLLVVDLVLLRRALNPLYRLAAVADVYDPLRPGARIPVYAEDAEIVRLTRAFNGMLERLEEERRDSARRALAAQEDERARIARELHDEIGQSLTGVLLRIEHVLRTATPETATELTPIRETARESLEEDRRIAQRLRPEALDDLGLRSALMHLTERMSASSRLAIHRSFESTLPALSPETELVIYRVAQEALTNVLRHSDATEVVVNLRAADDHHGVLRVGDNGSGMQEAEGGGMKGMRERAILIGADLSVGPAPEGGLQIRLVAAGEPQ
jgi:two-component system sensor histidine kinase UhpB